MSELTITEDDVSEFRGKLDTWAETLDDTDQAILAMIAVRAFPASVRAGDEAEVAGYTAPGGSLFEVEDYSFDVEQVLNIGSQSSGAGAGKVTFNPFSISRGAKHGFAPGTIESLVGVGLRH